MIGKVQKQESFDKIQLQQQAGVRFFGPLDRRLDLAAILRAEYFIAHVAAVNREKRQDLDERPFHAVKRHISGVAVAARNVFEQVGELDISAMYLPMINRFFSMAIGTSIFFSEAVVDLGDFRRCPPARKCY
jgi:hypothetical protein